MIIIPVFGKNGMMKLMSLHVNRQRRTLIKVRTGGQRNTSIVTSDCSAGADTGQTKSVGRAGGSGPGPANCLLFNVC